MPVTTTVFWNVFVVEAISAGTESAVGYLENDAKFPVRITVKAESQNAEKIKNILVVGKAVILRAICTDLSSDGAVVIQAF